MVFKLWIKTVKMLFGPITQEPLGLYNIYQKGVDKFEKEHKNANFGVGGAVPP